MSAEADPVSAGSAFFSVLQALAALVLVLAVVWFARRTLLGGKQLARRGERMKLEARLGLDLRNALVIVRVDERRLLLATSDHGPARLITELSPAPTGIGPDIVVTPSEKAPAIGAADE